MCQSSGWIKTTAWTRQHQKALRVIGMEFFLTVSIHSHNTSSVSEMIDELQWVTLEGRSKRGRLSMLYKIHNGTDASWYALPAEAVEASSLKDTSHLRGCCSEKNSYTRQFQENVTKPYINRKLNNCSPQMSKGCEIEFIGYEMPRH